MPAAALSLDHPVSTDLAHTLHRTLEQFLADHPRAAVLNEGRVAFEMCRSSYSLASDHGRCVLQLWSEEQNCVRTVIGVQPRRDSLSVRVKRFGRSEPETLQFIADRDTRTPTSRQAMRTRFLFAVERLVAREWPDWNLVAMRSAMDLEHSFGPAYARGLLTRGQSAWAIIAVNSGEMPATIDGILTLGILWLHQCRKAGKTQNGHRRVIGGLRVIVPSGMAAVTASRMAWLSSLLARWELWEIEPQAESLARVDISRQGNLKTRLVRACNPDFVLDRFQDSIRRVLTLVPAADRDLVEVRARSTALVTLSLHGLDFARIRHAVAPGTFNRQDAITFGAGASETGLTEETAPMLQELVARLFLSRRASCQQHDALYRLQPERWLESCLRKELTGIEPALSLKHLYSQVPAFASGDRGMFDLLTANRDGRVAVLELKADDDLQLPLQGLDYWLRVYQLMQQGTAGGSSELQASGYFPAVTLSPQPPLLYFVAPALRIHPANETVLTYFSEEIDWRLIALNEDWRKERKVIFRKHSNAGATAQQGATAATWPAAAANAAAPVSH